MLILFVGNLFITPFIPVLRFSVWIQFSSVARMGAASPGCHYFGVTPFGVTPLL